MAKAAMTMLNSESRVRPVQQGGAVTVQTMSSDDVCKRRVRRAVVASVAGSFVFMGCAALVYAGCIRDYFPRRAAADTLSPDRRFQIEAYTWIRLPRNELLDPAGVVRFRVRDWKRGGVVIASAEGELYEWDEFVQPTATWGPGWVELANYERWNTPRPIRLQWTSETR